MFVYDLGNRIYCANCYMKLVAEKDRKPIHKMDGMEFYHRFQGHLVRCIKCEVPINYDDLEKTTFHSLGGQDTKED